MIGRLLSRLAGDRMSAGIAWTMGSFVILAASGVLINIIVVWLRGAEDLGVFNQAYSIYIILSQFAAFGMHYSVLRHAAYHDSDRDTLGEVLASGAVLALISGLAFAVLLYFSEPFLATIFSPAAARAISLTAFGLALFPLNKMLIAFVNGVRQMRAFAILQALRYIIVAVVVTAVAASDLPFEYAALCFLVAEGVTAAATLGYIVMRKLTGKLRYSRRWVSTHTRFGSKSLFAGMFGEVNTRVDVVMLGVFLDDHAVGIYSFAAMLMDGLYHLLAMVRVNYNPFLVAAVRDKDWPPALQLLRRTRIIAPLATGALSVLIVAFFWVVAVYVMPERGLVEGLPCLIVLLGTLSLLAGYIPFDNMLLAGGYPGYQTAQQFISVATNIVLNVLLIPVIGILGAAIGTAASYVAGIALLIVLSNKFFHWNLLTNRVAD